MEKLRKSQAFLRKRKMMLVLPLLVIPFLTMAFWALGGGNSKPSNTITQQPGLNLNLPDVAAKDENIKDKLSFYEKADKDSAKMEEWMRTDPYYQQRTDTIASSANELEMLAQNSANKYNQRLNTSPYEASGNNPEEKLMQKLSQLQTELNKQSTEQSISSNETENTNNTNDEDLSRLENLMQNMNNPNAEDTEMKTIGNTLDKILDIQHPQRIRERLKEKSIKQKETVFPITTQSQVATVSLLDAEKKPSPHTAGFFGLENGGSLLFQNTSAEATVYGNQTLENGAVVQLRLATDIFVNGIMIPNGNPVNGIANLNNERMEVEINTIRYENTLLPVKLEVYDMDGLPGIYIPGSISRDVTKQSADDAFQLMELSSLDPSLKAQIAATGLSTVKNLLSKKVKQVKVMVKTGYKVLLRDKNTNATF